MKKILFFLTIFVIGCNLNKTALIPDINININEKAIYNNDSSQIVDFFISPTTPNNIWVINRNGPGYNLNVSDSTWTLLDSRFGKYSSGINNRYLFKDQVNNNLLWLGDFHGGLIIYDHSTESFTNYSQIKPVSCILFMKKTVLVGTWKGLYKIDRKTLISTKISKISEIYVNKIEAINEEQALINYKYSYNIITDSLEQIDQDKKEICDKIEGKNYKLVFFADNTLHISIGKFEDDIKFSCLSKNNILIDENNIWVPSRNLKDGIFKYDLLNNTKVNVDVNYEFYNYEFVNDKNYIWFYKKNTILLFDKFTNISRIIQLEPDIKNLTIDTKYILFNTWKEIQIWSKEYLIRKSYLSDRAVEDESDFQHLADSLDIYHISDFIDYYNSYKLIQSRFETSSNVKILKKISYLKENVPRKLVYSYTNIGEIERIISDLIQEETIRASAYLQLVEMANYKGDLKQSLHFDSILVKQYPEYRSNTYQIRIEHVRKCDRIIDSLNSANLTEDELLWETGNAYFELFQHVGPVTECSTINMTFPFTFYNEIIDNFPNSKYADNAEIRMFSCLEGGSHEGGDNSYNLTAIEEYKKLLKKYPDTELKPFVYQLISMLYLGCEAQFSERAKYYGFAQDYAELILNNYPDYDDIEQVTYLLEEINSYLSYSQWEFNIKSNKTDYTINEPINISFSLKNIDNKRKLIKIPADKNIPSFVISIYKYSLNETVGGYEYMKMDPNIAEYNKEYKDTIIEKNQTYIENWDIKRNARIDFREGPGRYNISQEGRYFIKAYCQGNFYSDLIPSNPIWITVRKK